MLSIQFDFLYRSYYKELFKYAMRILRQKENAEDAVQDCFYGLRNMGELDKGGEIKFLMVVLKHRCLDKMKSEKRKARVRDSVTQVKIGPKVPFKHIEHIDELNLADQVEKEISRQLLFKIITDILPPMEGKVIRMYLEGMSRSEIVEITGKSKKTIDWQKQRGIIALRQHLTK